MKNDPNIQELLKKGEVRIPEKKRNDQERTAPDPFFREAIKEAIERNSGMPDPSKESKKSLTPAENLELDTERVEMVRGRGCPGILYRMAPFSRYLRYFPGFW